MTLRKYQLDEKVFDNLTLDSAYWLGYLWGDGNCTMENKVRLAVSYSDRDILYQFRDFIKSNDRPIRDFILDGRQYSKLELRSWRIHNKIKYYGLTLRKDSRGRLPVDLLQYEEGRAFIRGLFDADGTFYYDGIHKNHLFAEISGYMPVLKDVKQLLVSAKVINEKKKIVKNGKIFRIRLAMKDTLKFIEYLYEDNPKYYLRRKYGIAKSYLERLNEKEHYVKQ